jgi:hypothetical protein
MPNSCFSYPADLPPGTRNRNAAQATLRDDVRRMPYPCFSYPSMCFSYPTDVPLSAKNRDPARAAPPGLRRMPMMCFSY